MFFDFFLGENSKDVGYMGGGVFKGVKGSKFRRFGFSFIFIEGRFLVFDYYVDVFIFVGY